MGLPRAVRMRRADFRRQASGRGRRVASGPLVVHLTTSSAAGEGGNDHEGPVRVGFAVGRSVGGAVVRNRVRRRLRAAASSALPLRPGAPRSDRREETLVVVRARPGAESLTVTDFATLLAQAWRRLQVPRPRRGARP
jgi:ribonuclease P protein component